MFMSPQLCQ